jgi:hypothetical protein
MSSRKVTLSPVRAAAAIVRRIKSYPGANHDTPIFAVWRYNQIEHITSTQIRNALQDAVKAIGEDTLYISIDEIGTHSIRSGAAMVMFLGGCSVSLIMMIGCWSSDAFLRYIHKQEPICSTGTFQIIHHPQFHISTQGNATIPIMPRQQESM